MRFLVRTNVSEDWLQVVVPIKIYKQINAIQAGADLNQTVKITHCD